MTTFARNVEKNKKKNLVRVEKLDTPLNPVAYNNAVSEEACTRRVISPAIDSTV